MRHAYNDSNIFSSFASNPINIRTDDLSSIGVKIVCMTPKISNTTIFRIEITHGLQLSRQFL